MTAPPPALPADLDLFCLESLTEGRCGELTALIGMEDLGPANTDRLHGDLGLELGAVGAAFAHQWEPLLRGGAPSQRLTMEPVQKTQTASELT